MRQAKRYVSFLASLLLIALPPLKSGHAAKKSSCKPGYQCLSVDAVNACGIWKIERDKLRSKLSVERQLNTSYREAQKKYVLRMKTVCETQIQAVILDKKKMYRSAAIKLKNQHTQQLVTWVVITGVVSLSVGFAVGWTVKTYLDDVAKKGQ